MSIISQIINKLKANRIKISSKNVTINNKTYPIEAFNLFNEEYYLIKYPDVKDANIDPLHHYLKHGSKEGRFPNPLFDPNYYRKKYLNNNFEVEPLIHYSENKGENLDTHPLFEAELYADKVGEIDGEQTLLDHFLTVGYKNDISPTPHFDFQFYRENNKDIGEFNPLIHYILHGENEGRWPNLYFSPQQHQIKDLVEADDQKENIVGSKLSFFVEKDVSKKLGNPTFFNNLKLLDKDKPTVICFSHEATRTGAPLIILKLAQQLKAYFNCNIINIVGFDGDILTEFKQVGPTYLFNNWNPGEPYETTVEASTLCTELQKYKPLTALVNSAESRCIIFHLKNNNIPSISLVHEMGFVYPTGTFKSISDHSEKIIFPSNIVHQLADENYHFPIEKVLTRGQGLLKEAVLETDIEDARVKLRKELGLPEDAFIVLSCGTLTLRKAPDLFTHTAFQVLKHNIDNIYFIWLGGRHPMVLDDFYWMHKDIEIKKLEDKILFVGAKDNPEIYFGGSDVFFMTSRADPFPCVIHEAMAVKLPILGFKDAGGFAEALEDNCGVLVEYADVKLAADQIIDWYNKPEAHKKMGENARNKVINQYNYVDYTLDIVKEITKLPTAVKTKSALLKTLANSIKKVEEKRSLKKMPTKKHKAIFTLPSWEVSGVNTFVENLVTGLNKLNIEAEILFTTNHHKYLGKKLMPKANYGFLGAESSEFSKIWQLLEKRLIKEPNTVFFPNHDYIASAISAKLPNKVATIGVLHSDDTEHYEHAYRLGRYWNKIVSVSKTIENKLLEINPTFKDKSQVIYYGINAMPNLTKPIKNKKLTLVYTGRIVDYQKRIADFVPIIEKLLNIKPAIDFEFLFIGDGPDYLAFEGSVRNFIKAKKVKMLGRVPMNEVYHNLSKSHAFVLVSDFEGLPLSLLEAMSMYCIPVLTDIKSGISEIISHQKNGLISPIGDADKFVENIVAIYEDEKLMNSLSQAAYHTIFESKLTTTDMAEQYAQLIDEALFEINNKKYTRPKPLTFNSLSGDIFLPPFMQKIPTGYDNEGNII